MTFWINQHLIETKELIHQWRINRSVKVNATVDHLEIASGHVILALNVGWENRTETPMTIMEIQVAVYQRGASEDTVLLRLLPLERFHREGLQRTLVKTPLSQFVLKPREIHMEHIRFISHQSLNLPVGVYNIDIQIRDTNHISYTRRTKIELTSKMKYLLAEDWTEKSEKTHGHVKPAKR